jgi:hypothetical protein
MLHDLLRVFVASVAIMQALLLVMSSFVGEDPVLLPVQIYLILFAIFSSLYLFVAPGRHRKKHSSKNIAEAPRTSRLGRGTENKPNPHDRLDTHEDENPR